MSPVYHFGSYQLDGGRRTLVSGSTSVPITARAFDILLVLVEEHRRVVEKDELLSRVWPDQVVEEGNLSQQIFVLRRLLGGDYITTVPRRGYQFVAPVMVADPVRPRAASPPRRLCLDVLLDPPLLLGPNPALALSRDGGLLVYVGEYEGTSALFARRLDADASRMVGGTHGASAPCLSPDGRWIAYGANGRLLRVSVDGGAALPLCDVEGVGRGSSWGLDHLIVFAPVPAGALFVVAATGGTPRQLTRLHAGDGERSHRFPSMTPSGRHVVFTVSRAGDASFDHARLAVAALDNGAHRVMLERASCGRVTGDTTLVCHRAGVLLAAEFDPESADLARPGDPQDLVATHEAGAAHVAGSEGGLLLYASALAPTAPARLAWLDSGGGETGLDPVAGAPEEPRLAPDGARVVMGVRAETSDLWLYDLTRQTSVRLTETHDNFAAVWTPDGRAVAFSSNRSGPSNLYRLEVGTGAAAVPLFEDDGEHVPGAWLPDGRALLFTRYDARTGVGIWQVDLAGDARPLMMSRFREYMPALSSDGRWLAYTGEASGTAEVYIIRFPDLTHCQQVTGGGGSEPVWSRTSRRLFYRTSTALTSVLIDDQGRISEPEPFAPDRFVKGSMTGLPNYDVSADARLLVVAPPDVPGTRAVVKAMVPFGARW